MLQFPLLLYFQVLLVLVCFLISGSRTLSRDKSLVNFQPKGDIVLSGRAYYVVLHIDHKQLLNQIKPISTSLEEIGTDLASQVERGVPGRRNSSNIDEVLTTTLRQHLQFLSKDLLSRQKQLTDFLATLGEKDYEPDALKAASKKDRYAKKRVRVERGLIDAGGQLLSYVFGTALDSEVQSTKEIVERLTRLTEQQRQQINIHADVLNSTAIHLDAVETQVNRVTSCLDAVRENIQQLSNHIRDNSRYEYTLAHSLVMSSSLSYASTALADLTTQVLTMKAGINKFKSGFISSDIIPPETILSLAETVTNLNLRPLFPATEDYVKAYYSYIKVYGLPHDPLSFVIEIPLVGDPVVKLKLYEVVALPHPVSANHVLAYSGLPKFLAISDDRELYQERSSQDNCRKFEDTILCPIDAPVYRKTQSSCAVALFAGTDQSMCQKHFAPTSKSVQLVKTGLGWVYSASVSTELTITCSDSVETVKIKIGSGILKCGDNCKVSASEFILPSSAEVKGSRIIKNMSLVHPFELRLNIDEEEALKLLNDTPILREIMSIAQDKLPLKSLKSEIGNIQHIQKMRSLNTISSHTGLTLSIVALLMTTVLCVGAALVLKYANNENANVENRAPDPVGRKIWRPKWTQDRKQTTRFYPVNVAQRTEEEVEEINVTPIPTTEPLTPRSPLVGRAIRQPIMIDGEELYLERVIGDQATTTGSPSITGEKPHFPIASRRMT